MKFILKTGLIATAILSISAYAAAKAPVQPQKFIEFHPGDSASFHVYYPGDKIEYDGHEYESVKFINNSHKPTDSDMLGAYWKQLDSQSKAA